MIHVGIKEKTLYTGRQLTRTASYFANIRQIQLNLDVFQPRFLVPGAIPDCQNGTTQLLSSNTYFLAPFFSFQNDVLLKNGN